MIQQRGKRLVWALVFAAFWVGALCAISLLEAPLKFQAPGITIPLGLGIGRLVFAALNILEAVILVTLAAVLLVPLKNRVTAGFMKLFWAIATVYLFKVLVVRPPLNSRTELVLAGAEPGQSVWHYVYIAADVTLLVLLGCFIFAVAKQLIASIHTAAQA